MGMRGDCIYGSRATDARFGQHTWRAVGFVIRAPWWVRRAELLFGIASPPAEPLPPAVWWVGGMPTWLAITAAVSGSATLLGSPPCPRIARRLLIGGERSAAASQGPVRPRGAGGSANPRIGPLQQPTRSCCDSRRPPGVCPERFRGRPRRLTARPNAQSHAACNGQRADNAQDIRADPHSAPPPLTVGVCWGSTVTHPGDGIETLRTNNSSSGYAPPIRHPGLPHCPAPEGTAPKLGIPGRCSPLSSRGVRLPGGVSRRPTARARRVIAFHRACAMHS